VAFRSSRAEQLEVPSPVATGPGGLLAVLIRIRYSATYNIVGHIVGQNTVLANRTYNIVGHVVYDIVCQTCDIVRSRPGPRSESASEVSKNLKPIFAPFSASEFGQHLCSHSALESIHWMELSNVCPMDKNPNVPAEIRLKCEENGIIQLNVGGHYFSTTRETLSAAGQSFFSGLISGSFGILRDSQGCMFIDRDRTSPSCAQIRSSIWFQIDPQSPESTLFCHLSQYASNREEFLIF
jgi:uncharacterized membrane protein YuzA (DUF378 family)